MKSRFCAISQGWVLRAQLRLSIVSCEQNLSISWCQFPSHSHPTTATLILLVTFFLFPLMFLTLRFLSIMGNSPKESSSPFTVTERYRKLARLLKRQSSKFVIWRDNIERFFVCVWAQFRSVVNKFEDFLPLLCYLVVSFVPTRAEHGIDLICKSQ